MPNYEWEKSDTIASPWEVDDPVIPSSWESKDPIDVPRARTTFGDKPIGDKPIGFVEAAIEDIPGKIPFSPTRVLGSLDIVLSARRLQKEDYIERPSFSSLTTQEEISEARAIGAWVAPTGRLPKWTPSLQRNYDIKILTDYFEDLEEKQRRGYTLGGKVGAIASDIPAYMIEFLALGGIKKLGTVAARKAATKVLRGYAATTAGKATIATGGFAIGTAAMAAGMPHRAAEAILSRQSPQHVDIKDDGTVEVIGPVEKPFTSIYKGLADHYIEIASERAGEVLSPGIGKLGRKLPFMGRALDSIQRKWLKLHPGKGVTDFLSKVRNKTGFHGVLSEIGEEYLGDITRAIFDISHFGAGEEAGMTQRLAAAVKADTDNLVPMAISFAIPGTVTSAVARGVHQQKDIDKTYRDHLQFVAGIQTAAPTQLETAEGLLGFTDIDETEDDVVKQLTSHLIPIAKEKGFKQPKVRDYLGLVPKWLLNRTLGLETTLKDISAAEESLQLEKQHLNSWVSKIIKKLKREKDLTKLPNILPVIAKAELAEATAPLPFVETAEGTIGFEDYFGDVSGVKSHILQKKIDKDTNPIHVMRDLLDTYENAPSFLTESETQIFNQVRELTRYLRQRVNSVREKMGLDPIGEVKEYITHWFDSIANQIIKKDLPIHSGYLYKLMRGLPKEIKNPTAIKRKIKEDLNSYFSKDLGKLLRIMIAFDLKDIHLKQPYEAAWDELQQLRKARLIPDSTYRQAENFLLYDIRKHKTFLDRAFDISLKKPVDLLNKILPTKYVIDDPSRQIFGFLSNLQTISGLGLRPKPGGRNLGQRLLLTDLYRTIDIGKAQAVAFRLADMPIVKHPITGESIKLIDLIREQDWYQLALSKFAEMDFAFSGVAKTSLYMYSKTHAGNLFLSNVEVSALTGYFDWLNMYNQSNDKTSQHYKKCFNKSMKERIPLEDLLTQESDMLWNIREAVRRTQWEYFNTSMPAIYRGYIAKSIMKFQSWWMNYFFNHTQAMFNQTLTGRNSLGRLLTPGGRLRAVKGLGTIIAISRMAKTIFGIEMLKYLFFPMPGYLPPVPELVAGLIQFFAADDDKERKTAWKRIKYGLKFWIPFSMFGKDLNRLLSGEYSISDFLLYKPRKKKK